MASKANLPSSLPLPVPGTDPTTGVGPPELLRSGCDVESVQAKDVRRSLLLRADEIHGVGRRIDHWRPLHPEFRSIGSGGLGVGEQGNRPERACIDSAVVIGVKGVNLVPGGRYVENVVGPLAGNRHLRHIEGLSKDLPG